MRKVKTSRRYTADKKTDTCRQRRSIKADNNKRFQRLHGHLRWLLKDCDVVGT